VSDNVEQRFETDIHTPTNKNTMGGTCGRHLREEECIDLQCFVRKTCKKEVTWKTKT